MTGRAERALRLSLPAAPDAPTSSVLAGLFNELEIGLVTVDTVRGVAFINRTAANLLGITRGDRTAAEFHAVLAGLAERGVNRGEVVACLDALDRDPATEFTSTWVFSGYPDHLGVKSKPARSPGFTGRVWTFHDNSPVAQAINAAVEASALLRATTDAAMDPQVVLEVPDDGDPAGLVYRDLNEAACASFGSSQHDMLGRRVPPSPLNARYVTCARTGEPLVLDAVPYHNDRLGALRHYDVRAVQVRQGLVMVTWRDVTDRIESGRRKAASETQFRLLADNVADVVVLLDDDSTIRWMSKSVEQTLGAVAERWIGHRAVDVALSGGRDTAQRFWSKLVDAGIYKGRAQIHGADGEPHTIHLHSKPFYDSGGKRNGVVVSFRVIDDEVAAEAEARKQIARRDEGNRSLARYLQAQTNRLMSELNSAARYVSSILPEDLDGPVAVRARYLPSEELGGDSYDFRWVDDDHLVAYLVDVSGHGIEPALLSVSVHNLLRSGTFDRDTLLAPSAVLSELNRLFQMDRHDGHYFTIWYGVYQASSRTLRFAGAGHPPALILAGGAAPEQLSTRSMPVGIAESTDFETHTFAVPVGAEMLIYSDGALELCQAQNAHRSLEELQTAYARVARRPDWTLDTLIAELRSRSTGEGYRDDCTFVRLSIA